MEEGRKYALAISHTEAGGHLIISSSNYNFDMCFLDKMYLAKL